MGPTTLAEDDDPMNNTQNSPTADVSPALSTGKPDSLPRSVVLVGNPNVGKSVLF